MQVVLILLSAGVASATPNSARIVGGHLASDGQFPYTVSVRLHAVHNCGGTILNERWILTAGHCIYEADSLTVVVGTNYLNRGGQTYEVADAFAHEEFDPWQPANDIGLLKTEQNIEFSDRIQRIPLNILDIDSGLNLVLSGWGTTSDDGTKTNGLQFVYLQSISLEDCKLRQSPDLVLESEMCTLSRKGRGACHGDSGGPLVYNGTLAGIVSWGRPCALGYPDVYTRVSSFIDWIQFKINSY